MIFDEVRRLYREGLGYRKIIRGLQRRYGVTVSKSTISYWVRGIYTPYYVRRPAAERVEAYRAALAMRAEGLSCKMITRKLRQDGYLVGLSTVKDWIAGRSSPYGPKPPLPLPTPRPSTHCPRRINLEPSVELAYVIGVVLGDGTATHHGNYGKVIALSAKDEEFVGEFARCLTKVLGRENPVKVRSSKVRKQKFFVARAGSAALYRLLHKPVDLGRLRPFIEHCEECMAAFLRGFVDSEGSVDKGLIYICNTNKELLDVVKGLLKRLGIEATGPYLMSRAGTPIYDPRGKMCKRRTDLYAVRTYARSAHVFYQKVGLTIVRKRRKLEEYLSKNANPLPLFIPLLKGINLHAAAGI